MDIAPVGFLESIKRNWRRRCQRVDDNRKRMKFVRLGKGKKAAQRSVWRFKFVKKLRFKVLSPAKLFAKFYEAYVNMMIRLVGENKEEIKQLPRVKTRVLEGHRPVPVVAPGGNEVVDGRMVMMIYKRLVSSRELSSMLVVE